MDEDRWAIRIRYAADHVPKTETVEMDINAITPALVDGVIYTLAKKHNIGAGLIRVFGIEIAHRV